MFALHLVFLNGFHFILFYCDRLNPKPSQKSSLPHVRWLMEANYRILLTCTLCTPTKNLFHRPIPLLFCDHQIRSTTIKKTINTHIFCLDAVFICLILFHDISLWNTSNNVKLLTIVFHQCLKICNTLWWWILWFVTLM